MDARALNAHEHPEVYAGPLWVCKDRGENSGENTKHHLDAEHHA